MSVNTTYLVVAVLVIVIAVAVVFLTVQGSSRTVSTITKTVTRTVTKTRSETYTVTYTPSTRTSGSQTNTGKPAIDYLKIVEITFRKTTRPMGNELYVNVSLIFTVKNIGEKPLTIQEIAVPDANYTYTLSKTLNPGETYSDTYDVIVNHTYIPSWEDGTEHQVVFKYSIDETIKTTSVNATVTSI